MYDYVIFIMATPLETTSVTIRVPNDILRLIDKMAEDFVEGKGTRSQAIITLLKKALDQPMPVFAKSMEKVERIDQVLLEAMEQIKSLHELIEPVRQDITRLDSAVNDLKIQEIEAIHKTINSLEERFNVIEKNKSISDVLVLNSIEKEDINVGNLSDIQLPPVEVFVEAEEVMQIIATIKPFSDKDLADRFNLKEKTIGQSVYRFSEEEKFYEWTSQKDPDDIMWLPVGEDLDQRSKTWIPSPNTSKESLIKLKEWIKFQTFSKKNMVEIKPTITKNDATEILKEPKEYSTEKIAIQGEQQLVLVGHISNETLSEIIPITGKSLVKRLISPTTDKSITTSLLSTENKKSFNEFYQWTMSLDIDNIGWEYKGRKIGYIPVGKLSSELHSNLVNWIQENP
jgi:hypothetical protein